jgi:hypothetical protein
LRGHASKQQHKLGAIGRHHLVPRGQDVFDDREEITSFPMHREPRASFEIMQINRTHGNVSCNFAV